MKNFFQNGWKMLFFSPISERTSYLITSYQQYAQFELTYFVYLSKILKIRSKGVAKIADFVGISERA